MRKTDEHSLYTENTTENTHKEKPSVEENRDTESTPSPTTEKTKNTGPGADGDPRLTETIQQIRNLYGRPILSNEHEWVNTICAALDGGDTPEKILAALETLLTAPGRKYPVTPKTLITKLDDDRVKKSLAVQTVNLPPKLQKYARDSYGNLIENPLYWGDDYARQHAGN